MGTGPFNTLSPALIGDYTAGAQTVDRVEDHLDKNKWRMK